MKKLILGVAAYKSHGTDEGEQLQAGLVDRGWLIAGKGYYDGCKHVPTLLNRHKPDIIFAHDQVDWHRDWPGCFDKSASFEGIECLAERGDIFKVVVAKDSGTITDRERALARTIHADAAVVYYHPRSVLRFGPWLADYPLIRTHHSIDRAICEPLVDAGQCRDRAIVTGALADCYPIRRMVVDHAAAVGVAILPHPGYGNIGTRSNGYLQTLSNFKVHVATASSYGFALRKIIESVAVGCTPVTNLPDYDVLPGIDDALVRISDDPTLAEVKDAVDRAERGWDRERALHFARRCWDYYDWREAGSRLDAAIQGHFSATPVPADRAPGVR